MRAELEGSQLGEYFGASVLGLKVNGEAGGDLLLVGAPMYTSRPHTPIHSGDEGKVYVYRNSKVAFIFLQLINSFIHRLISG